MMYIPSVQIWIWVPAFCTLMSIALVVLPIIEDPNYGYLLSGGIILAGLLIYFPVIYFKKTPSFMGKLGNIGVYFIYFLFSL